MIQLHRPLQPPLFPNTSNNQIIIPYYRPLRRITTATLTGKLQSHFPAEAHHSPPHSPHHRHDSARHCLVLLVFLGWMTGLQAAAPNTMGAPDGISSVHQMSRRCSTLPPLKCCPSSPQCMQYRLAAITSLDQSHICLRAYLLRLFSPSRLSRAI